MPTSIAFPSQKMTSVGSTLRFQLLPKGSRTPTLYTITAAADQTPVTGIAIGATDVMVDDTTLTLASPVTLPDKAKIQFSNGVSVRVDGAVTAGTALTVKPVKGLSTCEDAQAIVAIPANTPGTYSHGVLAVNSEHIPVNPLPVGLFPGEILIFDKGVTNASVVVASFAPKGATTLDTLPVARAPFQGALAQTLATFAISGGTDASPSSQPRVSDATNFTSVAGYEGITTGTNRTLSFSFQNILGDPGGDVLKAILYQDEFFDREIYAILTRDPASSAIPETYEGACIATQGDQSSPVQDLDSITANLQFQGGSFKYTPPSGAYDICEPDDYCPVALDTIPFTGPELTLVSAIVFDTGRNTVVIAYNSAIDPSILPVPGDYAIDTPLGKTVTGVVINGSTIEITVDSDFDPTDVISLSYLPGVNPLTGFNTAEADPLVNAAVINQIIDPSIVPILVGAGVI